MPTKHVVLIEDDPDLREIQEILLNEAGYRVTAFGAVDQLEELLTHSADLFVLDESLPVVSGHIICIYLRSKPETARTPVILVSAHPELHNYAGLCQANGYVAKPFDNLKFIDAVNKLLP